MRAHCITLYDDNDKSVGEIWLSSPGDAKVLYLDAAAGGRPVIELNTQQATQLRNALTVFLAEKS